MSMIAGFFFHFLLSRTRAMFDAHNVASGSVSAIIVTIVNGNNLEHCIDFKWRPLKMVARAGAECHRRNQPTHALTVSP